MKNASTYCTHMLASFWNLIQPKQQLCLIAVDLTVFRVSFFDDVDTLFHRKSTNVYVCRGILIVKVMKQVRQVVLFHMRIC